MGAELLIDEESNDVHHLLHDTVCVYKGEPVYVAETSIDHRIHIQYLVDDFKRETIDYREKDFRYMAPSLGYMNWERTGQAIYLRRDISGGRSHALTGKSIVSDPDIFVRTTRDWLRTKDLAQCIKGNHPNLGESLALLQEGRQSVAFHRHYAITKIRTRVSVLGRSRQEIGVIKDDKIILLENRLKPYVEKAVKGSGFNVDTL